MKTSLLKRVQPRRGGSLFELLTLLLLISCTFSYGQSSLIGNGTAGTGTNIFETKVKVVSGTPYIGFVDANASGYGSVMNLVGVSTWGYTGAQNNSSHNNYSSYDMQVSPSGVIYIAFDDKAFNGKATVKKYSAGAWSIVGTAGFTPGVADNLSLAFDSGGAPYVTYADGANSNGASVMKFNGTAWSAVGAPNFSLGATSYNKIIVDGSGFPYVLYESNADNSIHVLRYNGTSWAALGGAVTAMGFGADMVFNPSTNSIAVVYQDASSAMQLREMSTLGNSWNSLPALTSYTPNEYKMIYASGSYYLGLNENSGYLRLFKYNAGAWSSVGSYLNVNGAAPSQIGLDIDNSNSTGYMSFRDGNNSCSVVKFLPTGTIQVKQAATTLINNGPYNGNLTYDLGNTSYLQTTAVPFSITNTGLGKLSINSITSSNPADFIVNTTGTNMDIDPGQSTSFTVNFIPQGTSYRSSNIVVNNNDAAGNVQFAIRLSGTGVKGDASVSWTPPTITYGTNLVSVLNAQGYYQGNPISGSMAYKMDGVTVSPTTIPSAGTHALSVDFTPSDQSINALTGKTASLTVNKATVNVSADLIQNKTYGAADPILTYTFTPNLIPGNSFTGTLSRVTGENVGSYLINQGTLTAGNNYTISYTGANLSISPKSINVAVNTGQSKIYGTAEPVFTYTPTPALISGDVFTGALTRVPGNNVGSYPISQGTLTAGPNYNIGFTSGSFAITKKQITVTANAGQGKVYGGVGDPIFTYTPSPALLAGDSFFGGLTRTTGENVGAYAINVGSLWAGNGGITNYDIFYVGANFNITPKPVTVTVTAGQSKVYGTADPASFAYTFTPALLGTDVFTGSLSRTVAGENVGGYAIGQNTLTAGNNYAISFNGAYFNITPKSITITADASQSKVYGTTDPVFTYTSSSALISGDAFTGALTRAAGINVGNYALAKGTLAISPGNNYDISFTAGSSFAITPKPITVTANAGQNKIYGATDPALMYTPVPALLSGDVFTGALTRAAGNNTGMYPISQGTLSAGTNYTITFASSNYTIKAKPITVTANPGQSKVYGSGSDPVLTYTPNPALFAGDSFSGSLSRVAGENAGAYAIRLGTLQAGNGGAANYDITFNTANFNITPKPITVAVNAGQSKVYGTADPAEFTYNSTPALSGDDVFTGSLSRAVGENAGSYAISQAGLTAGGNYSITFNGAGFAITPKPVTITGVTAAYKVYNGNTIAVLTGGTLNGLQPADIGNVAINDGIGAFADKNAEVNKTVTASAYALSGAASANYSVAQPLINNATISKAALIVTPDIKARPYRAANPAFTSTFTGLVNGETPAVAVTGSPVYTTTANATSTVAGSPYLIHVDLSGVTSVNYQLTAGADANLSITKANQTISFSPLQDKNKNDVPFDISAVADSDLPVTFSVLSGPATVINNTITLSGVSGTVKVLASQAGDSNYNSAMDAEQDFDVNNKPGATVTFVNFSTTFGAAAFTPVASSNSSGAISYTVLPGGTGSATITNSKITPGNAGTVNVRASVASDATYNGAFKDAVMTIDKATQTIPALGLVATYNVSNADIVLPASTSSNLAITYASSDPAIASIINNNTLHFVGGTGQVTLTATQSGNANYNAAAMVTAVFTAKADQIITFNALVAKKYGDAPFTLTATGGPSGNAVTYVSSDLNVATVSGSIVTIVGAGTVTITAKQAGSANYNMAADVSQSLVINKADQTIIFGTLANTIVGSPAFSLAATSTSGLAVKYISANVNVATINGTTVTIVGAGSTVITATQAGDANYNAAPAVPQTLTVTDTRVIAVAGTLAFGDNIIGADHPSKNFTITNNGTGTLTISAITVPEGFTVDKTNGTITAGTSMTVSLTFTPVAAQEYNGTVIVTSNATSGGSTLAVTAKGLLITALADHNAIEGIEVYPNPSKGVFSLRVNDGDENASITGINGVTYYVKMQTIEKNLYKLDLTDNADGLYVLKCKSGKSVVTVRLVKAQ